MTVPISVRQQIITNVIAAFTAAAVTTPTGPVPFTRVAFGPLADEDRNKRFCIGVVPGRDVPTYENSFIMHEMALDIEFSIAVQSTDPGSQLSAAGMASENVLTACQYAMCQDVTWGGYAIDTKITGFETGVRVYAARTLLGVLNTTIMYRHNVLDPCNLRPGIG